MSSARRAAIVRSFALALASLGVAAGTTACEALLGIDTLSTDGGSGVRCQTPADCPQAGSGCFLRECVGGVCGLRDAPAGTPVASQVQGDCQVVVCDATGATHVQRDDDDVFRDGNECTADSCGEDGAQNPPLPERSACAGGVCDGLGVCVDCVIDDDCPGSDRCFGKQCAPASCGNEMQDPGETDVDCGGPICPACDAGKACSEGGDCKSKVCAGGVCQAPSCTDGQQNGSETDVDCGGASDCPRCLTGSSCAQPTDCADEVCACADPGPGCTPVCSAPTCSDGLQNGSEWAIDCGPTCAGTCDPKEPCDADAQCESGVCRGDACPDATMDCCQSASCSDGVKNQGEMDVDCGGPCPACTSTSG